MMPKSDEHEYTVQDEINDVSFGGPHVVILGAGASKAAFPEGDKRGKRLPVMDDVIEALQFEALLRRYSIELEDRNFEDIYSDLYDSGQHPELLQELERGVWEYFSSLQLPDKPNLYDHLICSLRGKDLIATFNWDPFLYQACQRNHKQVDLPGIVYLHGNVAVGYCMNDKKMGFAGVSCSICKRPFKKSQLLFPITKKNYNTDPFINTQWSELKRFLKAAFILTIFGYGAPKTDVEAIQLMRDGWGTNKDRRLEEIEIIDVKSDKELAGTWKEFIHTHHYRTEKSFYDSFMAKHPRRTCEAMWSQLMMVKWIHENPIPKEDGFQELWRWFEPLRRAEMASKVVSR